jgi:hypothetical protein
MIRPLGFARAIIRSKGGRVKSPELLCRSQSSDDPIESVP